MNGINQYQMDKLMKKVSLRANIDECEKETLDKICSILDVPNAQIIREGVRERMAFLIENDPKVREAFQN